MNRPPPSFRLRLLLWQSLLLFVLLAAFWSTAFYLDRERMEQRVDDELERFALAMNRRNAAHDDNREGRGRHGNGETPPEWTQDDPNAASRYQLLWDPEGRIINRSAHAPDDLTFPGQDFRRAAHTARTIGARREVILPAPHGQLLLAGRSIAPELAEIRLHALLLGLCGTGVLVAGLAGSWWLTTRAMRPINRMSTTAEKIAGGERAERIATGSFDSEFRPLAHVLNATFDRLQAAFDRQVRFTADASHELRTPVSVILLQTQSALAREQNPADYRQALEACGRAAQRMRRLVESLLLLARLDARGPTPRHQAVDLAEVVRSAVELLEPLAQRRAVTLACALPPTPLHGDPDQLGQVVTNLLSNALHHSAAHSEVAVTLGRQEHEVVLTVKDSGEGIAPEDLPRIFERFYRADKARARAENRTGLGLAISQAFVEAHGGRIEVTSELGRGSVFTVRLPAAPTVPR